jgi:predicted TIM-barrel fold metal-dependent hydrolase
MGSVSDEGEFSGPGLRASRRQLLAGLVAAGVSWQAGAAAGDGGTRTARRIVDVHAHYYPPVLKALGTPGPMNAWSLQAHLEAMEAAGVARSLLSLTTPGIVAVGEAGRKLMRESNEYAARTCGEQGGRLGFFAYVQPDDPEGALREIEHGLDVLKAQGIGLFTSYGSRWLGDPAFDPVFAELERRKAVVYVHPTGPACCTRMIPSVADTLIEYGTDTTRAIASFIYGGAARRFPGVRMIWSHSGGTMPFLIERFDGADRGEAARVQAPDGFRAAAAKFFYDIAQSSNPVATTALRSIVPVDHIVFGTDYPFRTPLEHVEALEAARVFNRSELDGLYRGNVERHLPALVK